MASTLTITGQPFTTEQMLPASGEVLSGAWAEYLARNTGALAYQPRHIPFGFFFGIAASGTVIYSGQVYITAGTYVGVAKMNGNGLTVHGTYSIDGTNILGTTTQGNPSGTGTFIVGASGWVALLASVTNIGLVDGSYTFSAFYRPCKE